MVHSSSSPLSHEDPQGAFTQTAIKSLCCWLLVGVLTRLSLFTLRTSQTAHNHYTSRNTLQSSIKEKHTQNVALRSMCSVSLNITPLQALTTDQNLISDLRLLMSACRNDVTCSNHLVTTVKVY